jgi:2-keto-4-pentenoate hydratase/2-oxohepta-3-ene-1,7-dioic acid hydratase in catechol pathway
MKLVRYLQNDRAHLGILHSDLILSAERLFEGAGERPPTVVIDADLRRLAAAPEIITILLADYLAFRDRNALRTGTGAYDDSVTVDPSTVRILAPIPDPGKIICIGLNYADHCREQGKEPPPYPILFSKFANAICGPDDPILLPPMTTKLDYEAELGVVIGMGGSNIPAERALAHVFGYTCVNDVSARDLQKADGQWLRAKGMDNFAPTGPCIVSADEIPDPQNLPIRCRLNGQTMQDSNTREMVFPITELIAFISRAITLSPGDIISTGTPDGVGLHRNPPVFLKDGDTVEVEIEGIGTLRNRVQSRP